VTLGRLCVVLAERVGNSLDPPVGAAAVLAELALEWGGHG